MPRVLAGRLARHLAACALVAGSAWAPQVPAQAAPAGVGATFEVALRDLPQALATEGVVEAVRQATLGAQVAGRITELAVKAGDPVRAGQVLARIDARTAEQAVAATRSQVAEAEANLANARRRHDRNVNLFAQKFVSQAAVDQSEAELKAAQAQVEALRANAVQASAAQTFTTITAPFAGVVGATHVELGDMAQPGRQLVTVFDPKELRVTATLPQASLAKARLDQPVEIEVAGRKEPVRATRVTVIPLADARTHTTRVRLDLPPTEGLLPGQFARAWFVTGTTRALAVPASALLKRGEVTAVYVVDRDGRALLRQVRAGEPVAGGMIEILAGLAGGERIAQNPVQAGLNASVPARPAAK
jgi:RND family efflux transporter MFP subunit